MPEGFPDLSDPDAAERWVDDWQAGIVERAARASALSRQVSGLSVTAWGGEGLVEVTVGPSGVMTGLKLDERVREHPASWIAEQVLATLRTAQERLADRVRQAVVDTVGADSQTGQAVLGSWSARLGPEADRDRGR